MEVSPPDTGGMAALRAIKMKHSNFKCGTFFGGRSRWRR